MVLDRNPDNYFAEVEQAAFEPANIVPGIGPSPDRMLLGRLFSYPDTHRHRIGTNYLQLPINQPRAAVDSYNKDGAMRFRHGGAQPVYAPNSFGGPAADPAFGETVCGGRAARWSVPPTAPTARMTTSARPQRCGAACSMTGRATGSSTTSSGTPPTPCRPTCGAASSATGRRSTQSSAPRVARHRHAGGDTANGAGSDAAPAGTPPPARALDGPVTGSARLRAHPSSSSSGVEPLDRLRQPLQRLDDVLAVGLAVDREAQRGDLAGEELGLGQGPRVGLAIALDLGLVSIGLAVLRQEDQRRRVSGLGRGREVQKDERVRVKARRDDRDVERDPDDDDDGLADQIRGVPNHRASRSASSPKASGS